MYISNKYLIGNSDTEKDSLNNSVKPDGLPTPYQLWSGTIKYPVNGNEFELKRNDSAPEGVICKSFNW